MRPQLRRRKRWILCRRAPSRARGEQGGRRQGKEMADRSRGRRRLALGRRRSELGRQRPARTARRRGSRRRMEERGRPARRSWPRRSPVRHFSSDDSEAGLRRGATGAAILAMRPPELELVWGGGLGGALPRTRARQRGRGGSALGARRGAAGAARRAARRRRRVGHALSPFGLALLGSLLEKARFGGVPL